MMYLVGCVLRVFAPLIGLGVIFFAVVASRGKAGPDWGLIGVGTGIGAYVLGLLITSRADVQRANRDRTKPDTGRQR